MHRYIEQTDSCQKGGELGDKKVKGLSKNTVYITHRHRQQYGDRGKVGLREVEERKRGINRNGNKLYFGEWEHYAVCMQMMCYSFTLKTTFVNQCHLN